MDIAASNLLIYIEKYKSETDLRKMVKITEGLPKIEKAQQKLSHMRRHPKKGIKRKKDI